MYTMYDLFENIEICRTIVSFSDNEYLFLGTVNKNIHGSYVDEHDATTTSYSAGIEGGARTQESIESGFRFMVNVYKHAVRLGRMETILHFYEARLSVDIRECFIDSILYDRDDIFRWVVCKCDPENTYWFDLACHFGKIRFLAILEESGFAWSTNTSLEAAEFGQFDALVWLYDRGCPMDERVILRSAVKGYEDIVEWYSGIVYYPPVDL